MWTEAELFAFLPLNRKEVLAGAIGRRLIEVERYFTLNPASFLEDERFTESDFFSYNSGPVQLVFEGGLVHELGVWGEQLSIVVLDDALESDEMGTLYRLSQTASAPPDLKACLGKSCEDVRIWTFREDIESEEAKQAAVSYVFSGGPELFYSIYLHGDLDSDYLLAGRDVPRQSVASCFSLAEGLCTDPTR